MSDFDRETEGSGIALLILATNGITQENEGDANTDEKEAHDSGAEINQHQDVGAGAKGIQIAVNYGAIKMTPDTKPPSPGCFIRQMWQSLVTIG